MGLGLSTKLLFKCSSLFPPKLNSITFQLKDHRFESSFLHDVVVLRRKKINLNFNDLTVTLYEQSFRHILILKGYLKVYFVAKMLIINFKLNYKFGFYSFKSFNLIFIVWVCFKFRVCLKVRVELMILKKEV